MATKEEIVYSVSVEGNAGKSLSDLKKEFKEAQKELSNLKQGTKEYTAQLQKLGSLKDEISDLNTTIKSFNPEGKIKAFGTAFSGLASGFTAAQGAVGLFSNGNKDLEKTLVKVQAAMAFSQGIQGLSGLGDAFKNVWLIVRASPILMITTAITALGVALYALKDKVKVIGDAFDAVTESVKNFTDWIGLTTFALDKQRDAILKNNAIIESSNNQRYDAEIASAKRAGKETELLEMKKASLQVDANNKKIASLDKNKEDDLKQINELKTANIKLNEDILNAWDSYNDKKHLADVEATKKHKDELEKQRIANLADYDKRATALNAFIEKQEAEEKKRKDDKAKQDVIDAQTEIDQWLDIETFKENEKKRLREEDKANEIQHIKDMLSLAQRSNDSLISLSDLFFSVKNANLKKGSAEELKSAKQQFKINKALAMSGAIITGVQSVMAAYASGLATPIIGPATGAAYAVMAGLTSAANIAKIASQQFNAGGGGGGAIGAVGGGVTAPTISAPRNDSTLLNGDGTIVNTPQKEQPMIKAYVVESEISKTQKRVSSIETNAKI